MLLFTHPSMLRHEPPAGHAEHPGRLQAVLDALEDMTFDRRTAPLAAKGAIARVHPRAYIEALEPAFKQYQRQVIDNARVLATVLHDRGLRIVSGGTDSHLFLVDLRGKKITGKDAEAALAKAHITVNKNAIPNDPEKPFVTSGIRIGSPAVTTRGFTEIECEELGHLIADLLDRPGDESTISRVKAGVAVLTTKLPVYR